MLSVINFIHNSTLILQEPPRTRTEAGKREMVTQSPKQPRKQERPEELVKTGNVSFFSSWLIFRLWFHFVCSLFLSFTRY